MRDEVTPFELSEAGARILRRVVVLDAEVRDCAGPENGSDHRRVVRELLLPTASRSSRELMSPWTLVGIGSLSPVSPPSSARDR